MYYFFKKNNYYYKVAKIKNQSHVKHLEKFSIASMTRLNFDNIIFYVEIRTSYLAWLVLVSKTRKKKIVARLVKKLIEASHERVEPAHEFVAHGSALARGQQSISGSQKREGGKEMFFLSPLFRNGRAGQTGRSMR
jgi:hypothetical protein